MFYINFCATIPCINSRTWQIDWLLFALQFIASVLLPPWVFKCSYRVLKWGTFMTNRWNMATIKQMQDYGSHFFHLMRVSVWTQQPISEEVWPPQVKFTKPGIKGSVNHPDSSNIVRDFVSCQPHVGTCYAMGFVCLSFCLSNATVLLLRLPQVVLLYREEALAWNLFHSVHRNNKGNYKISPLVMLIATSI